MCADIVIVGAGPVGLWTAIQLKKRNPSLDVQLYERHEEYQRSHVLRLENLSMLLYSKNRHDAAEEAFFKEVTGKHLGKLARRFKASAGSVYIRTQDLEKALKNYAKALGVKVDYETVTSPEALMAKHPECKKFIAADGAHSRMRTALLGEEGVEDIPLQYVAEVKYQARGKAGKLGLLDESYKTNKLLSSMAFEYVGREKEGATPVTLRFFIDKAVYDAMPEAGFKNPLTLGDDRLPKELAQDIATYMNVRQAKAGETCKQGSAKISKLTLSMYAAKKFAVELGNGCKWFFVGDAAMGVPYFRALNSGMIVGSQLAHILTGRWMPEAAKVKAYNAMRPLDIAAEFTAAVAKDSGIRAYDSFRRMSAGLPWEMVKWRDDEAEAFRGDGEAQDTTEAQAPVRKSKSPRRKAA
jgi:2-polyprenyl-6-methoxyphenol hydroxylase-like FAD-dependent oxidoreductase